MKLNPHILRFLLILSAILLIGLLSACAPGEATPTPTATMSIEAVYTSAAQTIVAQLTQTAAAQPSATLTPTATITPTGTITPTAIKTAVQYSYQPAIVLSSTTTGSPGPTLAPTLGGVGCNNAAFLSDVTYPDGTTVKAGESFTKTWSIKNTGTCSWNNEYKLTFIGGDLMGSDTFKIRRTVGPNISTEISTNFTAPNDPGTYTGYWRMADDSGVLFGESFSVSIKIAGETLTPTDEVDDTSTPKPATSTPKPATATTAPTATATTAPPPTDTLTPIPTT
jgi:hypothetical protein